MQIQNQFVDLYRSGIRTASDVAKTSLETSVRLQEKQLDIVRNILDENKRSADRLAEAHSLQDLVAVQTRLAAAQMERVAEFWSTLWQAAADQQKSLIGRVTSSSEDFAQNAANQASRAAGAMRKTA